MRSVKLVNVGRWRTLGSKGTHNLTVLDATNLTNPTNTSMTKLIGTYSLDMAECTLQDSIGFCYASTGLTKPTLEAGHKYLIEAQVVGGRDLVVKIEDEGWAK